jgi:aldose 1-epimerase
MRVLASGLAGLFAFTALAGYGRAAPRVQEAVYGVSSEGKTVHVFTLTNDHNLSVRILDLGGILTEVNAPDRKGVAKNVVLGLGDLKAYEKTGALNSLIGRYANRLKGGFTLDGKHYDLAANAKGVTIHGGRPSYGARVWQSALLTEPGRAGVVLSLVSPDGDQGFPGELKIKVTYSLDNQDDLALDYEETTDKPTVTTLTNHVYFNLAGNGSGSVYGQKLQVMADQFTPTDEDQVPTGALAPVAGTALDFRRMTPIGARVASSEPQMLLSHGYDHNFVLNKPAGDPLPLAVRLYDPASGRLMEMRTSEPGVQVYSANNMTGNLVSAAGTTIRQGDGLALETEHYPDSPNKPNFPSTVLRPGAVLRSRTVFHFTTDTSKDARLGGAARAAEPGR